MSRGDLHAEFVHAADALADDALRDAWSRKVACAENVNAVYASPEWVEHALCGGGEKIAIWMQRDAARAIKSLIVFRWANNPIQFGVGSRVFFESNLRSIHLLGSIPIGQRPAGQFRQFFESVMSQYGECESVYLDVLPTSDPAWSEVFQNRRRMNGCFAYVTDGPRPWHTLELSDSFEDYLHSMTSKSRSTLRRKVRQSNDGGMGALSVERISAIEHVPCFLTAAKEVSQRSWQHRLLGERIADDETARERFSILARHGVLRSYLLRMGKTPCAFVIGYQYSGVFHYAELGFREDVERLSPGTVLLFKIIEDLHDAESPKTLNFGVGDASYKRRFGNRIEYDASCVVLRHSLKLRAIAHAHASFNFAASVAKKAIGRKVTK